MNLLQKIKKYPFLISLLIAFIHGILGSWLAKYDLNPFVEFLILPYTFIAGMSYFAGWGALSFILVIISILFITLIIYPIVILVIKDPRKNI